MKTFVTAIFGQAKIKLTETPRPVTPFGGLASFVAFLEQTGYPAQVQQHLPWQLRSPNAIPLSHTLTAFCLGVVAGARRFAQAELLRADRALGVVVNIPRWPGADTIRGFFHRFSQATIQSFWRPLWRWQLGLVGGRPAGFSLDLDSTVFQRSGQQAGVARAYNPQRPGRGSHHPLLAVLAELPLVLHGWLRSGNASAARGVVAFLGEALALLPEGLTVRTVRADSGFYQDDLLDFLETRHLPYIVVAKRTPPLQRLAASLQNWEQLDERYAVSEFRACPLEWQSQRRFLVVRERLAREESAKRGRLLLDVPGYVFHIWVTNRSEPVPVLWHDYNDRATVEQRIEELKNDLGADDFCTQDFWATESAFLAVLFTFNLLSLYQQLSTPNHRYRQPATLRTAVFLCGAILGRAGRQPVLHLSVSWGGLAKHKPLLDAILSWPNQMSPKLIPPEDRLNAAPCRI